MTEPFRFSSRHSEFVKLKAEALISAVEGEGNNKDRYKVVMQYPDGSSSYSMLQIKEENFDITSTAQDRQHVYHIE